MKTRVQALNLNGKKFVVLERDEYDRLKASARHPGETELPALPDADGKGNRPALEYLRTSIARDIIRERKALGISQEKLAELAGIRQESLSRLESGKHSPTVRTVEKIERALQLAAKQKRK